MTHTDRVLEVLKQIRWADGPCPASPRLLEGAGQFLKGSAELIGAVSGAAGTDASPFVSPFELLSVDPSITFAQALHGSELAAGDSWNAFEKVYIRNVLEWAALCDSTHPMTQEREWLFEPLLAILSERVFAAVRGGFWVVDQNMFPLQNWQAQYRSQ